MPNLTPAEHVDELAVESGGDEPAQFRATIHVDLNAHSDEHATELAWALAGEIIFSEPVISATVDSVY